MKERSSGLRPTARQPAPRHGATGERAGPPTRRASRGITWLGPGIVEIRGGDTLPFAASTTIINSAARTVSQALATLDRLSLDPIDELWLDFDLGNGATVQPVLDALVARHKAGQPVAIGIVYVHTASAVGAHTIKSALRPARLPDRACLRTEALDVVTARARVAGRVG